MMLDKTKFQNTTYTADATRHPDISQHTNYVPRGSNVSQPFQASRVSENRRSQAVIQGSRLSTQNMRGDFMVYCPVCRKQYRNSEMGYHAAVHDSTSSFDFRVKTPEYLDRTQDTIISTGFSYPLVQPLQFYTNQLSDSVHNDNFFFKRNQNYDGVDHRLFAQKREIEVQTLSRPPLQYETEKTNIYNCLDNAVNSGKGPKFSFTDIFGKNEGVTPKRELDEWEYMQIDPNQKTLQAKKRRWW